MGKYSSRLTIFTKANVNGEKARSTWRFLREYGLDINPTWNFKGKFIVDSEGVPHDVSDKSDGDVDVLIKEFTCMGKL